MPSKGFATNPGEWTPNFKKYSPDIANELKNNLRKREERESLISCDLLSVGKISFNSLQKAIEYTRSFNGNNDISENNEKTENNDKLNCLKTKEGQKTFRDYGFPKLRYIPDKYKLPAPELFDKANSPADALNMLKKAIGLNKGVDQVVVGTSVGELKILEVKLSHTIEKFEEHREKYANCILATYNTPLEIWKKTMDNGNTRYMFIAVFNFEKNKTITCLSEVTDNGNLYFDLIHSDIKESDSIRRGENIYNKIPTKEIIKINEEVEKQKIIAKEKLKEEKRKKKENLKKNK